MVKTLTRPMMRLVATTLAALAWLPAASLAAGEEIPAQAMIRETTEQVLKVMRDEGDNIRSDPEKLYKIIDELILPRFDFRRMSQWVLGRNWRSASEPQRSAFTMVFRDLLVQTYSKALLEFRDRKVEFLAPRVRGDDEVTVRAQVDQGGGPMVPVSYEVARTDGAWKVYDVSVNGVSLVINYRSSFNQEVQRNGIDGLIERIRQRTKQTES